jgi:hypothetical protein
VSIFGVVQTPIHWEAVLITAIPAGCAMIAAIASGIFSYLAARTGTRNKQHLVSIDRAVNGAQDGEPTLRENVVAINHAVNGSSADTPSIQADVKTLVGRRDLDPDLDVS